MSPCPWRPAHLLDRLQTLFRAAHAEGVFRCSFSDVRVTYVTWGIFFVMVFTLFCVYLSGQVWLLNLVLSWFLRDFFLCVHFRFVYLISSHVIWQKKSFRQIQDKDIRSACGMLTCDVKSVSADLDLEEDSSSAFSVVSPTQTWHVHHTLLMNVHVTGWE